MQPPAQLKALVVDDDPGVRLLLGATLTEEGLAVREASDGREALDLAEQWRPDLVLMDVIMPVLDGFEACVALRETAWGKHIPVVVITGLDDIASIELAFESGATDFVTKPINYLILRQRVRYIVRATEIARRSRESEALVANAQRIARLAHLICTPSNGAGTWSPEMHALLGTRPGAVEPTLENFLEHVPEPERVSVVRQLERAVEHQESVAFEHRLTRVDGTERVVRQVAELITDPGAPDDTLLVTVQDFTAFHEQEARIHELSYFDGLTGLPNRNFVRKQLRYAVAHAERSGELVALISIGLDRFRRVNDTLGHRAGDTILREVATRLENSLREGDTLARQTSANEGARESETLARMGGDQFLVMLSGIREPEGAMIAAKRLARALAPPITVDGVALRITASMGLIVYPDNGADVETLLTNVDATMHHAQRQGVSEVARYSPDINARASRRLELESQLQRALEQEEFDLAYQPKIELDTGRLLGVEALLRWRSPVLGCVPPLDFIGLAEESGLIVPIGSWVLGRACERAEHWFGLGYPRMSMAVNVSAIQFHGGRLIEEVDCALRASGVPAEWLELEVTEGILLDDTEHSRAVLSTLRERGVSFAIDDFGIGFSSMAYLKRLPVNSLKIDRSFVKDLGRDLRDGAIVNAIITMGRGLGLRVVAEGVETEHQVDALEHLGCREAQGYLFARPLAEDELLRWIEARDAPTAAGEAELAVADRVGAA